MPAGFPYRTLEAAVVAIAPVASALAILSPVESFLGFQWKASTFKAPRGVLT